MFCKTTHHNNIKLKGAKCRFPSYLNYYLTISHTNVNNLASYFMIDYYTEELNALLTTASHKYATLVCL